MTQKADAPGESPRWQPSPPTPPTDTRALVAASVVLQHLHDEIPIDHFILGWLMPSLHKRSFGIIMRRIAVVAFGPGLSTIAGLLHDSCFQMIAGKPAPVFPPRIGARALPTKQLSAVVQRSVPVLGFFRK